MITFSEIVDASTQLTLDEQESFVDILNKRIIEEKRKRIIEEVFESQKEFESGDKETSSIDEILKEILYIAHDSVLPVATTGKLFR